jgi:hypothetical protein
MFVLSKRIQRRALQHLHATQLKKRARARVCVCHRKWALLNCLGNTCFAAASLAIICCDDECFLSLS